MSSMVSENDLDMVALVKNAIIRHYDKLHIFTTHSLHSLEAVRE